MKTLDELGISPAPWDYQPNNPQGITVADRGNWTVGCFPKKADARLIAAAPILYKTLRALILACHDVGYKDGGTAPCCEAEKRLYALLDEAEVAINMASEEPERL